MIEEYKKEKREIQKYFKQKKYFIVILTGVQLLEKLAAYINEYIEYSGEETDEKMGEPDYSNWKKIRDIYTKSLRKIQGNDAPRLKILEVFFQMASFMLFEHYEPKEFISLMHKVERVVSCRNDLAHKYFDKKHLKRQIPLRARECIELISELENYPLI